MEIAHHQPSSISKAAKLKIHLAIPKILDNIGFRNGASHIEFKVLEDDEVALIEVNPRGGGDEISSTLVSLSTTYDYMRSMIDVALGCYVDYDVYHVAYAGIYYLCSQTKEWCKAFKQADRYDWLVRRQINEEVLHEATGNADRCGFLIYKSSKKVNL